MKMSKRITKLEESPCYQCGFLDACEEIINKSTTVGVIRDRMFGNANADYHDCGIWIALNAPEMIEE